MDVDDSPAPGAGNDGNATQANSKQMQEKIIKMHPVSFKKTYHLMIHWFRYRITGTCAIAMIHSPYF